MAKGMSQTASYRACFSTDAGKRVLGLLLLDAGYFDTDIKTSEEAAVLNYAKKILSNLGLFAIKKDKVVGVESFVQKLFEIESE